MAAYLKNNISGTASYFVDEYYTQRMFLKNMTIEITNKERGKQFCAVDFAELIQNYSEDTCKTFTQPFVLP